MTDRSTKYAESLAALIRYETVSVKSGANVEKFRGFHALLREQFPHIFAAAEFEDYDGSILLHWRGSDEKALPILFMNHHDVVEAPGAWKYPPFAGTVAEGKVWGRGTLDTKGGLWGMLTAADELAAEGFVPPCDIYFESGRDEETNGFGAKAIAQELKKRGIRFAMVLDEGGMIPLDPIGGTENRFAMIGVGEKGASDIKFIARSNGGHASAPGKDTPLVRLGKFMAAVEKSTIFPSTINPTIKEMFRRMGPYMKGVLKNAFEHVDRYEPLLRAIIPTVSDTAGAMLKTTLAFTMAKGSDGSNVLPQEAWVVGNMRFSHHQGGDASRKAVAELAKKYDIETEILEYGIDSPVTDYNSPAFKKVEAAVIKNFPGVIPAPYIMTGASDSRWFSDLSDNCIRFVPFVINDQQLGSIHALNENVDVSTLAPAVDFYKDLMRG